MAVQTQIQVRRGTASSWTSTNPTLAAGEWGLETDTGKYKVGDGSSVWTGLGYASILPSTVTTKGDLLAATGSGAVSRLAAGSNGYTLVADSSTSTGLAYGSTALANPFINGGMDIWQRNTSFSYAASATGAYTADRWYFGGSGTNQAVTISRQATGDTTNLPNIQYSLRLQRNSGQTGTGGLYVGQSFETVNSIPFVGRTVTYSFYARAGANYSAASGALNVYLMTGTGTDQTLWAGYTNAAYPVNTTATLTTTWQRFTYTATLSASATEIGTYVSFTPVGTAGTNDWFEVTGFQLDLGSTALPFRRSGGTIQGELAAAQRYYWRQTASDNVYAWYAIGYGSSTTQAYALLNYPVTMRVAPSAVEVSNMAFADGAGNVSAITSATLDAIAKQTGRFTGNVASGLTQFRPYVLLANNNTAAYIGVSAEL